MADVQESTQAMLAPLRPLSASRMLTGQEKQVTRPSSKSTADIDYYPYIPLGGITKSHGEKSGHITEMGKGLIFQLTAFLMGDCSQRSVEL